MSASHWISRVAIVVLAAVPISVIGVTLLLPKGDGREYYRSIYPVPIMETECTLDPLSRWNGAVCEENLTVPWSTNVITQQQDVFRMYRAQGGIALPFLLLVVMSVIVTAISLLSPLTPPVHIEAALCCLHVGVFAVACALPWMPSSLSHRDVQRDQRHATEINWHGTDTGLGYGLWLVYTTMTFIADCALLFLVAFGVI